MEKMKCPCRGCVKRTVTCHVTCRECEDWRIYQTAVKEDLRDKGALYVSDFALRRHWDNIRRPARKHRDNAE